MWLGISIGVFVAAFMLYSSISATRFIEAEKGKGSYRWEDNNHNRHVDLADANEFIYFGNGSGSGVRPYRTSNGDYPTNAEAPYGGYVTLTQNSFVPYDDTGIDSDRLIFFQTDGNTEYEYLYDWTFWVR